MVKSESGFKTVRHAVPYVVGLAGINTKVWKDLPANPCTDKGNIECAAYILSIYYKKHGDYLLALKAYKGWSKLGERQARLVLANT